MEHQTVSLPRVMVAAPASSSGKTSLTCALLQAALNLGVDPCAFKCGPDYIDPLFHREVLSLLVFFGRAHGAGADGPCRCGPWPGRSGGLHGLL